MYPPKRKVVLQPSFFRGELLNFGGVSQFNYRPLYWTASPAFTSAAGRFVVVTRPTELDAAEAERLVWEPTLPRYDFHDMM